MPRNIGIMGHFPKADLEDLLLHLMSRKIPLPIIIIDHNGPRTRGIEEVMGELCEKLIIEIKALPPMQDFMLFDPVSHQEACREKYASILRTNGQNLSIAGSTKRTRWTSSSTKLGRRYPR